MQHLFFLACLVACAAPVVQDRFSVACFVASLAPVMQNLFSVSVFGCLRCTGTCLTKCTILQRCCIGANGQKSRIWRARLARCGALRRLALHARSQADVVLSLGSWAHAMQVGSGGAESNHALTCLNGIC